MSFDDQSYFHLKVNIFHYIPTCLHVNPVRSLKKQQN